MEQEELIKAVQGYMNAKTPEEMTEVLQRKPELLNKENIEQVQEIAIMASLSSDWQTANALEKIAELLTGLSHSISETGKVNSSPINQTTVIWARLAREYLTFRKNELLEQAIVSAQQYGENEIASLLRASQENNIRFLDVHANNLHQKLLSVGKREEALTVALVHLDTRAQLAENFILFPLEQQALFLEIGIHTCQQAVSIADGLGDEACKASYLIMTGNGYASGRQLESAESAYQEALKQFRKLSEKQPQVYESIVARTLNNLGLVLRNMHRLESAESAFQEALKLYRKLSEKQSQVYEPNIAGTLNNLGLVLHDMHRLESAESAFQEALKQFRELAEKQPQVYEPDVGMTLNNLGIVLRDMRRLESAESAYQEALNIRRKLAEKQPQVYESDVGMTLNNLGTVLRDMRRLESAESAYQEALKLYRTYDIPDQMAGTLSSLSRMWMEKERWEEAAKLLDEAKEKVERLRVETLSPDRRMQIFRKHIQIYENLLVCLMKLGRIRDALVVAEAGKSRTLADLLAMHHMMPRNVPGELAQEYNRMLIKARSLEHEIEQGGVNTSRAELVKTHSRLQELVEDIRRADPDFMPYIHPPDIQEIQSIAKEAQSTLVLFRVTERGSFVFLVFPDGGIDSIEVPEFTARTLNDLLVTFKDEKPDDGWLVRYYAYRQEEGTDKEKARHLWLDTMDATAGRLYELFLKYVHERLKGKTDSLVFIPNRGLSILPLHA